MEIYNHKTKDRFVLEVEENEFTLIAYLVEKSHQKHKTKLIEPLATKMNKEIISFYEAEEKKESTTLKVAHEK